MFDWARKGRVAPLVVLRYHPDEPLNNITEATQKNVNHWFLANQLSMNNSKTQTLNFSLRHSDPIVPCDPTVRFLGVSLDPGLSWEEQVTNLCNKLSRVIYLIRMLVGTVSMPTLLAAYHGYFASLMSYGVLNWGHSAHASKVFKLQRRCVRVIVGLKWRDCCWQSFKDPGILTFPSLYILNCLVYIRSNMSQFTTHGEIHDYQTRNRHDVLPGFHRLTRTRGGSSYYCIKFYNKLQDSVKQLTDDQFKNTLKGYLKSRVFYSLEDYLNNDFSDL